MRGLLLFIAVAASAQENRGFVNSKLVAQNFVNNSLKQAKAKLPVIGVDPPASKMCAIPLLEAKVNPDVDKSMVIRPGANNGDRMIIPTIPVCGKN